MASSTFIYTVCHGPVLKYLDPGILGESPLSSSIGINSNFISEIKNMKSKIKNLVTDVYYIVGFIFFILCI